MSDWFVDGVSAETLPIDDRAVQYGDGVFETIAVRDGRPRLWDLHMQRLRNACDRMTLTMPAESILQRDVEHALARTSISSGFCSVKIIVSAGSGPRGYRRPSAAKASTLIGVFESAPLEATAYRDGVKTLLCKTAISSQPKTGGIKTLNRLDQVFASAEWNSREIYEGLMCDADDLLICGTRTNVFVVNDDRIRTPALDRSGVAGVMRRFIINRLADNGIDCAKVDVQRRELKSADEVFLSNSQIGVVPVRVCSEIAWPVGEATRSVMAMLAYNQVPECRL